MRCTASEQESSQKQLRQQLLQGGSLLLRGHVSQHLDRVMSAVALASMQVGSAGLSFSTRKSLVKDLFMDWPSEAGCRLSAHSRTKSPMSTSQHPYTEVHFA